MLNEQGLDILLFNSLPVNTYNSLSVSAIWCSSPFSLLSLSFLYNPCPYAYLFNIV